MKNLIAVLLSLFFVGCHFSSVTKEYYVPSDTMPGTTTTNFYANIGSNGTYTSTRRTGSNITHFKSTFKFTKDPSPEINIGLQLIQGTTHFTDTIRTAMFADLIDFKHVVNVQLDSITYQLNDIEVSVRFIVKLDRLPDNKPVIKESYTTVYSSTLDNPSPMLHLEKIEQNSVEVFGKKF